MGTIARLYTLKIDTRQTPSLPNGYFISIFMGFVSSALGAVAIPALLAKDFVAVTFLTLGIQHFRDIRKTEQESLCKLEKFEYTRRGGAYINGIAKNYESRYYFSLIVSLLVVLVLRIIHSDNIVLNVLIALFIGIFVIVLLQTFTKGKSIGDICTLKEGKIKFENSDLKVNDIYVTNEFGSKENQKLFENEGIAIIVEPTKPKFEATINSKGQKMAMLFEATHTFGKNRLACFNKIYVGGKVIIAFVPILKNEPKIIMDVIKKTPVLEESRKIFSLMGINANTGGSANE